MPQVPLQREASRARRPQAVLFAAQSPEVVEWQGHSVLKVSPLPGEQSTPDFLGKEPARLGIGGTTLSYPLADRPAALRMPRSP